MLSSNKTRIVATIGPASNSPPVLEQMIRAGMNVARLNFSHGEFEAHRRNIENIRAAAKAADQPVAIMADLSGPKMRIGQIRRGTDSTEGRRPFHADDRGHHRGPATGLGQLRATCPRW